MKEKGLKSICFLIIVVLVSVMAGCGGEKEDISKVVLSENKSRDEYSGQLVLWSHSDEVKAMDKYFAEAYPNIEIEYVVIPYEGQNYLNKVNTTLRSGADTPDIFTGEYAFYKQFVEAGYWEPLGAYGAEDLLKDLVDYVPNTTRNENGEITALAWQATPGALFYRRSIAKDVLGTDDPEEVSKWTSDLDNFYELGEMVNDYYNGEKWLLAGYSDMCQFIYNMRSEPYIVDGAFSLPEELKNFMDVAKNMRDNDIEMGVDVWSPPWFSSMADGSVMCYVLPTWGLHYVLKPNAEPKANEGEAEWSGDWGMAVPPASYSWGGTWIGINRNSKKKDLAWQVVKYFGSDPEFLEAYALDTGDFVSNQNVIDKIKDDFSEPFLGGQNHYAYFAEEAKKIDVSYIGPWDLQIQNAWDDQIVLYATGKKDKNEAVEDFYASLEDILPDVRIEK